MRKMTKVLLACAGTLAFTATTASAEVVCNAEGDCWHAKVHRDYRPEIKLSVHPEDWRFKEGERDHRWREHEGRGYWRNGIWIDL